MSGGDSALRWLRYADEDLRVAQALLGNQPPRIVCFNAQQAAEKAIKAVLVRHEIDFPRSHDLQRLQLLLPATSVTKALANLSELTDWSV